MQILCNLSGELSQPGHCHCRFHKEFTRKGAGTKPSAIDGQRNAEWVAMDFSDVLVHVFLPEARNFYNLEHLWADAKLTTIPDID